MDLLTLSLNYRESSVQDRESWSIPAESRASFLSSLHGSDGIHGAVYLQTCNREELYAVVEPSVSAASLIERWRSFLKINSEKSPHVLKNEEAFAHLVRVACGLDAMVLGETQVFGQVKESYAKALEWKTTGPLLNFVFQNAFRVAKKIRTETGISQYPISVSTVAVMLLDQIYGEFQNLRGLVVGLGAMGKDVALLLQKRGIKELFIMNRTEEKAHAFAQQLEGRAQVFSFGEWGKVLPSADFVVACTAAEKPVLTKEILSRPDYIKLSGPRVLIDLGVPRDIDPALDGCQRFFLYNVDDLQNVAAKNRQARQQEANRAEMIIQDSAKNFYIDWSKRVTIFVEQSHLVLANS